MSIVKQVLCSCVACYLSINIGVMFTWPSTTLVMFQSENTTLNRPMTDTEAALLSSLSCIGSLIATPAAGFLLDIIGRKYCAITFSLMNVVCWALLLVSNRVEVILTSIFISGIGGALFLVVPVYISEFCHESIRGAMTSGVMVFFAVGMVISYAIGGCLDYYPVIYVCLSIAVFGIILLGLLKESPLFLLMKGKEEEAKQSLAFYRNSKPDAKAVLEELEAIRRTLNPELDEPDIPDEEWTLKPIAQTAKLSLWQFIVKSYSTRRALAVSLALTTASIFQGIVVVQVYAEPLFSQAMPTISSTVSSVLFSIVTVVTGIAAAYLTDAAGRKPLMFYSSIASGVCCLLIGLQIDLHWGPYSVTAGLIYLFCAVSTFGAGTIPYVLSAELFLPEIKSFVTMLVTECIWLCNFIILFIYYPLESAIGLGSVFYLFAIISFVTAVITYFFLPETRGLPVDAIQILFSKKLKCVPSHSHP